MRDPPDATPSPVPRRRLWPVLLLGAGVLVVGLNVYQQRQAAKLATSATASAGVLQVSASASGSAPAPWPAPAASSVAPAAEPTWGQAGEAAARVSRAASAALATARSVTGLGPQPAAETVLDLCGIGRLTMRAPAATGPDATWETLPLPLGVYARQQAWPQVLAAMDDTAQPDRVRAAAQVLRASGMLHAEATPVPAAPAPVAETAAATRALARLARRSDDATVMSWALAVCSRQTQASADCKRISARDLSRLAPDDAQSWLAVAAMPGLPNAEQELALQKAGQAARFGGQDQQLPLALDSAWPTELPGYLRPEFLVAALGVELGLGLPFLQTTAAMCGRDALQTDGRRASCEAMARQMQAHGRTLLTAGLAHGLGQRLGWPEAELAAMAEESKSLFQAVPQTAEVDQPYACDAVEDTRQWFQAIARDGELAELRRRRAISNTTPKPAPNRP